MYKINIAKEIYLSQLNTTKKILDLLEFKEGKDSEKFQFIKKELFDYTYNNLKKIFIKLESEKLIKRCPKGCSIRQGYTQCEFCNGSGYTNY
jgi:hypothetical protein